jgi:hypothetical protein
MAKKAKPPSSREGARSGKELTWAEIVKHLESIQAAIENHRREGDFENFQSIAPRISRPSSSAAIHRLSCLKVGPTRPRAVGQSTTARRSTTLIL